MRNRFGRFALVGSLATAVDIITLLLAVSAGAGVAAGNLIGLVLAAALSYTLHRWVTFADSPYVRWVHAPGAFALIAVLAGAVDMTVLLTIAGGDRSAGWSLAAAKAIAVALALLIRGLSYRGLMWRAIRRDQDQPVGRPPAVGAVRLSVIVPAFDEAEIIGASLTRIRDELSDLDRRGELELIVVDDGSSDATAEQAATGADRVERLESNRGKGAAIRRGMEVAGGSAVGFIDADLAYSPDQLLPLLERIEEGWDVVVGSRRHDDTTTLVRARRLREIGGRAINLLTQGVLLGQYRDTQCGLKMFRGDVARVLAERTLIDRFAFDVELFHLVERYRLSLCEVPVRVENSSRSSVRVVRDAARMVMDLLRIRRWAARGHYSIIELPLPTLAEAAAAPTTAPGALSGPPN